MRFKKIYIEITNNCNLNCDFCIKNKRNNKFISESEFQTIIEKIKPFTNYIYLHVLGEPLLHPKLENIINIANANNIKVNITTNGYLINRIKSISNIRQVNISLHSFDGKYNKDLDSYLTNIVTSIDELIENNTYISLRLWVNSKYKTAIINYLNNYYKTNIDTTSRDFKIKDNLYFSIQSEFIWPDLNNSYYNESGTCYGLKDHIGILVDGTIIPCCLDSEGIINLGNIYTDNLEDILNKERPQKMLECFKNNKKCEELCRHCKYL